MDTSGYSLSPELLNIHSDILTLIPWVGYENSDQGAQPIGLEEIGTGILSVGITFLKLITWDAETLAQLLEIFTAIIQGIAELFTKLREALWIALKVAILIKILSVL